MKKSSLALAMTFVLGSIEAGAASLQLGDHLTIDAGSYSIWGGGAYGTIPLLGEQGITVGPAQGDTGSGSHGGAPTATDVGAVTQPWSLFGNTGYEYLSMVYGSGSFGGDTTNGVDMTSWMVSYNSIDFIVMGGCFLLEGGCVNGVVDTGIGNFAWSGVYGDTYTIDYTAHWACGLTSNSCGTQYDLHLTGIVTQASVVPIPTALWLFASGLLGLTGLARRNTKQLN